MNSASRVALALVLAACAGCFRPQNELHGQCGSDADCSTGARCDKTQSPPVCVAAVCNPACGSTSACDLQSVTCKPVTQPSVVVTSPAANGFVGSRVQVAATARAPGGATGVTFQVRNAAGVLIGTGAGSAPPGAAEFAATISIGATGLADGGATVTAILAYPSGSLTSAPVPVTIDVTPPAVTSLQVFLEGASVPAGAGVKYPDQPPGAVGGFSSGHDGTRFILNDKIHLKGTISDSGAGLSCASLRYRIDSLDSKGNVAIAGAVPQPLPGCSADGVKSLNFDVSAVSINDTNKFGVLQGATGNLQLAILTKDAVDGSPNANETVQDIQVTRFFWNLDFARISPAATVTGLTIHPNLDLIVTNNATSGDSAFGLFPDGPFHAPTLVHWNRSLGSVLGAAAVGTAAAGEGLDPTEPMVYIASSAPNKITALRSDGNTIWTNTVVAASTNSVSVVPNATNVGGVTNCEAVLAGGPNAVTGAATMIAACRDPATPAGGQATSVRIGSTIEVIGAAPISIAGGSLYTSTDKSVARSALVGDGSLATPLLFAGSGGGFTGVLPTGGAKIVSGSVNDRKIYGLIFTGNAATPFTTDFSTIVSAAIRGIPILSSPSVMSFVASDNKLHSMSTTGVDGVIGPVITPGGTPLLGHDGIIYLGRSNAVTAIKPDGTVAWELAVAGNVTVPPTLDCKGTLYAAAGNVVYAVLTDMAGDPNNAGLADTPWPKFQRDSRNTGNADIATKFGVRTAPGPGGCIQ